MSSKQNQFLGKISCVFVTPTTGNSYWGQVYNIKVQLSNFPTLNAGDYVQFDLDAPGAAHNKIGIKAVDPAQASGKVLIPGKFVGQTDGTVDIDVYADGKAGDNVIYNAAFHSADGQTVVPVTGAPITTIMSANPGLGLNSSSIVVAKHSGTGPAFKPSDMPQNYFHIKFSPETASGVPITNGVFVASLSLISGVVKGNEVYVEGALNNLKIYKDKLGNELLELNPESPRLGTIELVKSNKSAVFEFFICAGETELNGDVHLDLIGHDDSSGKMIVTDLSQEDSALFAPRLNSSLVDVATVATVAGEMRNSPSISYGSKIFIVLSHVDPTSHTSVPVLVTTIDTVNAFTWNAGQNKFSIPTSLLAAPAKPGTINEGIQNFVSYISVSASGEMAQSSGSLLKAWRSAPTVPPIEPPMGSSDLAAPTFPDAGADFPNRVTPEMCRYGLKVQVDWSNAPAGKQYQDGSMVNVGLILTGWDANTGAALNKTVNKTHMVTTAENSGKKMVVQFDASDTADFRDDPLTGALGSIVATYWTLNDGQQTSDLTSQSVINEFYSTGVGSP